MEDLQISAAANLSIHYSEQIINEKNTIDIVTLGCSKNLVDSEKLMKQLEANGYKVTHDSEILRVR